MKAKTQRYIVFTLIGMATLFSCQTATSSPASIVGNWTLTDFNSGFGPMTSSTSNFIQTFSFASDGTFTVSETNSSGSTTGSGNWTQAGKNCTVVLQKTTGTSALGPTSFVLNDDGSLTYNIGGGFYMHYKRVP